MTPDARPCCPVKGIVMPGIAIFFPVVATNTRVSVSVRGA